MTNRIYLKGVLVRKSRGWHSGMFVIFRICIGGMCIIHIVFNSYSINGKRYSIQSPNWNQKYPLHYLNSVYSKQTRSPTVSTYIEIPATITGMIMSAGTVHNTLSACLSGGAHHIQSSRFVSLVSRRYIEID